MSYETRVYRQRNAHVYESETESSAFFNKKTTQPGVKVNKTAFFQSKLSIGQPNDAYEKEADAVANAVVNHQPGNAPVVQQKKISSIQRLSTPLEEEKLSTNDQRMLKDKEIQEKPEIQRMCPECEKEKEGMGKGAVQTKPGEGNTATPQLSAKIESSVGKGNRLSKKTLSEMNASFGADFSQVRIHTDSEAVQMNKELGAQAFTHGSDIYFNSGKYNADTADGKQLLAHELTHVVQQGAANNMSASGAPAVQANCEGKSFKNCGGACTHPTSGNPGTCRWTGVTNGCKCFENPRSTRTLEDVLPYWILAILSAAAIAAIAACFASGVCEAGIIIGAAGAAVGAIIIGIFRAAGITVNEEEGA
jgi:uncharacterized protein YlaI